MDRITRHPLLQDLPFETIVDYTVDFIRVVGTPKSFIEKVEIIPIKQYRGELPCDIYSIIQVRLITNECEKYRSTAFRYSTNSFHFSNDKERIIDLTYKIQGNCIFTNIEECEIEIAYRALPTDEDGLPLIPDDSTYLRALDAYVKKQWFTIQFDLGKINPAILQKAEQDYAFYVGQAQSRMILPSIDEMESISNMWNTLVVRDNEHRKGFINSGTKEYIRIH